MSIEMETEFNQFKYFDLMWLKELSLNETKMLSTFTRSFIKHMPEMLSELREATEEQSVEKVSKAIRKISSVAALFTQKDYGSSFLIIRSKDEQLSPHTVESLNSIIQELEALQMEVTYYHYHQFQVAQSA
jgi:hypothetical protein